MINSEGMLCREYPIGSEGRIIDVGKTDQSLTVVFGLLLISLMLKHL